MSILNGYCTLAEFKQFITPPGQTLSPDTMDDDFIERCVEVASRRVDNLCGRTFYPRVDTKYYDVPGDGVIWLDDDLLQVITLKNGDATTIASTDYILKPTNSYPKYCIKLRDTSTISFLPTTAGSNQEALTLLGFFGFHEWYENRAWVRAGTLGAAWASATTLTATLTAGHTLAKLGGEIIRIDAEIFNTASTTADTLTVLARGDNGSTAISHVISSVIYVWHHMDYIKALVMEIARIFYKSRYGENVETTAITTPSGVIVTPRSLPVWAQEVIQKYQRIV